MPQDEIDNALQLFELAGQFTQEQLDRKKQELLLTWNPHRYANLTNNPKKYMQMYKQAEALTKQVHTAYELLASKLKQE